MHAQSVLGTNPTDVPAALAAGYDRVFLAAAAVAVVSGLISTLLPTRPGR